jgi:hypothetical protein
MGSWSNAELLQSSGHPVAYTWRVDAGLREAAELGALVGQAGDNHGMVSQRDGRTESTDLSNRDSNKGIVTIDYKPYQALLDRMKVLNDGAYELIVLFDGQTSREGGK